MDDKQAAEWMVDENIRRKNYNPIELGFAFALLREQGKKLQEIATKYGYKTHGHISKFIDYATKLPKNIQDKTDWGVRFVQTEENVPRRTNNKPITPAHNDVLLSLDSPQKQIEVAKLIEDKGLSAKATEVIN